MNFIPNGRAAIGKVTYLIFIVDWITVKKVIHLKFKILDAKGIWRATKATAFSLKLSVSGNRKLKI